MICIITPYGSICNIDLGDTVPSSLSFFVIKEKEEEVPAIKLVQPGDGFKTKLSTKPFISLLLSVLCFCSAWPKTIECALVYFEG
jgi:hypothetical protein